jgi:sigma-E factor negative regulatory protein RseB
MKRLRRAALAAPLVALGAGFVPGGVAAQQPRATNSPDARGWLHRMYEATKKLSYTGTFVYQHGAVTETSRITRLVEGNHTQERIEVLDGSPREIIRSGSEIKAYLPASMTIKVERAASEQPMLPLLPTQVGELAAVYELRKAELERIAGFDSQSIVLEPRDKLRYGHKFWADIASGMLLKAQMFDEKKDIVEQFIFTQLRIGASFPRAELRARAKANGRDWRVEETATTYLPVTESPWVVRSAPAGFKKQAEMKRTFKGNVEVSHIVMSDGLAAVSVFVEPITAGKPNPPPLGLSRQGAINIFTRKLENHLVTVVGEAPAACVEAIANGLEQRPATVAKP